MGEVVDGTGAGLCRGPMLFVGTYVGLLALSKLGPTGVVNAVVVT